MTLEDISNKIKNGEYPNSPTTNKQFENDIVHAIMDEYDLNEIIANEIFSRADEPENSYNKLEILNHVRNYVDFAKIIVASVSCQNDNDNDLS
jgi:hypothetical protein